MTKFCSLHNHSDYSFLDGFAKIEDLVKRAKELEYESLALTEHGNMCSAVKFARICEDFGIKPIHGQEFYIVDDLWVPNCNLTKTPQEQTRHIILLAKNEIGFKNLIALSTVAHTRGFYYNPRINFDLLRKHSEGVICLTACLNGVLAKSIKLEKLDEANEIADALKSIFSDDLYVELQTNGLEIQRQVNGELRKIADRIGAKCVATTDVHYVTADDYEAHDAWLCIRFNKKVSDPNRKRYEPNAYYLPAPEEIPEELKDAAANTIEVSEKCNVKIKLESGASNFPESDIKDPMEWISIQCLEALDGLSVVISGEFSRYSERLDYELRVIDQLGFGHYFVIIADIISWCKRIGIRTGPARGSGAASLVCYLLGITEIDPIEYDLIFERFLHEDRVSPPDLDLDFQQDRRDEVIEYVKNKYGASNVASICNFSMLQPKQAIKDAMRVLGIEYKIAESISKMIPEGAATIKQAVDINDELRNKIKGSHILQEAFKLASKFQGHLRQAGTHAAGIVVTPMPLNEIVPLQRIRGNIVTQFDMHDVEALGLLKMDLLGLRTLTIIENTIRMLNRDGHLSGEPEWDLKDENVYEMLRHGDTKGCFMLETDLLTRACIEFEIDKFDDLILIGAICRPVTLESGMKDECLKNKKNPSRIKYLDDRLKPILKKTYATAVFQEQIMQICQVMAGFSMIDADKVRKLIGKGAQMESYQKDKFLRDMKEKFYVGCKGNNVLRKTVDRLWKLIANASYGFNKPHATSYAKLSFMTAWLRHYFPTYFFAAVLSSVSDRQAKVADYARECRRMGIEVIPPDAIWSKPEFTVDAGRVRFGLNAIKGIGVESSGKISDSVEKLRDKALTPNFNNIATICESVGKKQILQALTESGALDKYITTRKAIMVQIGEIIKAIRAFHKGPIQTNQELLFGGTLETKSLNLDSIIHPAEEFTLEELALMEYDRTGIFLSTDPLKEHRKLFLQSCVSSVKEVKNAAYSGRAKFGGVVVGVKEITTKKHDLMAKVAIETVMGVYEFVMFPSTWNSFGKIMKIGKAVIIRATPQKEGDWIAQDAREVGRY